MDEPVKTVYTSLMPRRTTEDPVMKKVRKLADESGLSLHELGLKMDCPPETARQSVWQFLRSGDPHISVLRRFAIALGLTIEELVGERKRGHA